MLINMIAMLEITGLLHQTIGINGLNPGIDDNNHDRDEEIK